MVQFRKEKQMKNHYFEKARAIFFLIASFLVLNSGMTNFATAQSNRFSSATITVSARVVGSYSMPDMSEKSSWKPFSGSGENGSYFALTLANKDDSKAAPGEESPETSLDLQEVYYSNYDIHPKPSGTELGGKIGPVLFTTIDLGTKERLTVAVFIDN